MWICLSLGACIWWTLLWVAQILPVPRTGQRTGGMSSMSLAIPCPSCSLDGVWFCGLPYLGVLLGSQCFRLPRVVGTTGVWELPFLQPSFQRDHFSLAGTVGLYGEMNQPGGEPQYFSCTLPKLAETLALSGHHSAGPIDTSPDPVRGDGFAQ